MAMMSLVESLAPDDEESEDDDEDEDEEDDKPSPFVDVAKVAALLSVAETLPPPNEVEVTKPLLRSEAEGKEACVAVGPASATGPTATVDVTVGVS